MLRRHLAQVGHAQLRGQHLSLGAEDKLDECLGRRRVRRILQRRDAVDDGIALNGFFFSRLLSRNLNRDRVVVIRKGRIRKVDLGWEGNDPQPVLLGQRPVIKDIIQLPGLQQGQGSDSIGPLLSHWHGEVF